METLRSKIVTTRKVHRCFACLEKIETGSKAKMSTVVDQGDIWTNYYCECCTELLENWPKLFEDSNGLFDEGCIYQELHVTETKNDLLNHLRKTK